MKFWPLVPLLGGCAQIAGIENTSGSGREGLSLAIERVSIGSTIVRTPQDLTGLKAQYLLDVGPLDAAEVAPGTWGADVFDATPPVVFDLPDDPGPRFDRLATLPSKNLLAAFDVLEHPAPVASAPTDTISVVATLDTAQVAETYELFVVGTWTVRGLEAPLAGTTTLAPAAFEIQSMASLTGRPIEQITLDDTPLILRRNGTTLTGVIEATPFAQAAANELTGAFGPLAADQTLQATVDPTQATNRLGVARPAITAGPNFAFTVNAAPGAEVGSTTGPLLVSGAVAMIDTAIAAAYPNPFVAKGWPAVLTYSAAGSRTLTPTAETLPVSLSAGMTQVIADPAAGLVLDFPAPVPEQVSIAGTSLSLDNVQIAAPTAPVDVTVVVGTADAYVLELRALVPNATNDALVAERKLFAIGREPAFSIPPEYLVANTTYSIRIQTITGLFPNIADGDLNTRALPAATAFVDTGVFRVMP